jgi:hypothetical protein
MKKYYNVAAKICTIATIISIALYLVLFLKLNRLMEELMVFKKSYDKLNKGTGVYPDSEIYNPFEDEISSLEDIIIYNPILLFIIVLFALQLYLIVRNKFSSQSRLGSFNIDYLILVPLNLNKSYIKFKKVLGIFFNLFLFTTILSIVFLPISFIYELYVIDKTKLYFINEEYFAVFLVIPCISTLAMWFFWSVISLICWVLKNPEVE